jgi:hypothetical protein
MCPSIIQTQRRRAGIWDKIGSNSEKHLNNLQSSMVFGGWERPKTTIIPQGNLQRSGRPKIILPFVSPFSLRSFVPLREPKNWHGFKVEARSNSLIRARALSTPSTYIMVWPPRGDDMNDVKSNVSCECKNVVQKELLLKALSLSI